MNRRHSRDPYSLSPTTKGVWIGLMFLALLIGSSGVWL